MSGAHEPEATPQLTTTHIGGGRRAWLIALTAVVVLGIFVYLGLSGGASVLAPRGSPAAPALAVVPTPIAVPKPPVSFDPNEIVSLRADPTAPVLYQYLGTALTINGQGVLAILDPVGPLAYRGMYRIPVSQTAPTARLEFDAVTASVSHDDLDRIGQWSFPINSIGNGTGPPVIVLDTASGDNSSGVTVSNPDFNRELANGYHLTVTTQNQGDAALMTIDLAIAPEVFYAQEAYQVTAGPPGDEFGFELESFGHGGYDGQGIVPRKLLGTTLPVTLTSVPLADLTGPSRTVGTWSIQLPRSVADAESGSSGKPVGVVEPDFEMSIAIGALEGDVYLNIVLNERPLPSPGE